MLRAALVDVGGTLWPDRPPPQAMEIQARRLSERFALSLAHAEHLVTELADRDPASIVRPLPLLQDSHGMTAEALAVLGVRDLDPHDVLEAMDVPAKDLFAPFDDAKAFLEQMRAEGLRTIVFSNSTYRTSASYRRDFEDLSLGPLVDEVVSSVDLGYRKPAPQMFEAAVKAARCAADECVVVGDSEEKDIVPAKRTNMCALLVVRDGSESERSQADVVVADLREAAEIISGWTTPS